MAIVMSLFSDAEMKGVASVAAPSASSVCAADSVAVPNVSARRADASSPSDGVLSEPAPPQVGELVARLGSDWGYMLNPCVQCRYRDLCDDDYCAMLLHPIDMPHAPSERGWRYFKK